MPKSYQFRKEQISELEAAKKKNKNKNVDKRLEALLLRAQKVKREEVSEKTGFCKQYITDLTASYHNKGLAAIVENHYAGNRRNMSFEEEEKFCKEKGIRLAGPALGRPRKDQKISRPAKQLEYICVIAMVLLFFNLHKRLRSLWVRFYLLFFSGYGRLWARVPRFLMRCGGDPV